MSEPLRPEAAGAPGLAGLAGLAREVEALRREVVELRVVHLQVGELAAVVADLSERVTAERGPRCGAISWLALPAEHGDPGAVLADLAAWMGQVYLRYPDAAAMLPECWLWHPEVIEELVWLWRAWLNAYRTGTGTAALAGDWHDRARPGVVRRICTVTGTCSMDNHQGGRSGNRAACPVPMAEAIEAIAAWWERDRTGRPPEASAKQIAAAAARRPRFRT